MNNKCLINITQCEKPSWPNVWYSFILIFATVFRGMNEKGLNEKRTDMSEKSSKTKIPPSAFLDPRVRSSWKNSVLNCTSPAASAAKRTPTQASREPARKKRKLLAPIGRKKWDAGCRVTASQNGTCCKDQPAQIWRKHDLELIRGHHGLRQECIEKVHRKIRKLCMIRFRPAFRFPGDSKSPYRVSKEIQFMQ